MEKLIKKIKDYFGRLESIVRQNRIISIIILCISIIAGGIGLIADLDQLSDSSGLVELDEIVSSDFRPELLGYINFNGPPRVTIALNSSMRVIAASQNNQIIEASYNGEDYFSSLIPIIDFSANDAIAATKLFVRIAFNDEIVAGPFEYDFDMDREILEFIKRQVNDDQIIRCYSRSCRLDPGLMPFLAFITAAEVSLIADYSESGFISVPELEGEQLNNLSYLENVYMELESFRVPEGIDRVYGRVLFSDGELSNSYTTFID
jgi:hypothetical protein